MDDLEMLCCEWWLESLHLLEEVNPLKHPFLLLSNISTYAGVAEYVLYNIAWHDRVLGVKLKPLM